MNPGFPGAGLSLMFYLGSALWMPFDELIRLAKQGSTPQRLQRMVQVVFLALGVLVALTGGLLLLWLVIRDIEIDGLYSRIGTAIAVVLIAPGLLVTLASLIGFPVLRRITDRLANRRPVHQRRLEKRVSAMAITQSLSEGC